MQCLHGLELADSCGLELGLQHKPLYLGPAILALGSQHEPHCAWALQPSPGLQHGLLCLGSAALALGLQHELLYLGSANLTLILQHEPLCLGSASPALVLQHEPWVLEITLQSSFFLQQALYQPTYLPSPIITLITITYMPVNSLSILSTFCKHSVCIIYVSVNVLPTLFMCL